MTRIEVRTQVEFEAAVKMPDAVIAILEGSYRLVTRAAEVLKFVLYGESKLNVEARGSSQPHVEAWESSQPHVVARGSSQPHVVAWESSQPHVVAWESSQPHVVARGSSQPHVEAWESSQPHVEAWESSQPHVEAWGSSQPHVVARGSSQPHVEAWESSQPHVVAWGSSQPHVVAWESSQPHVEAWESSQPHVEAWGSSQPHVVARGFVQVSLRGQIKAKATANCAVLIHGSGPKVEGGQQIKCEIKTPADWCDYYGVPVEDDVAILYKGVNNDFVSPRCGIYKPGEILAEATDWDGGQAECGGGWHFSPHPKMTLEFNSSATKFVAVPIRLTDFVIHPNGDLPQKVKGRCGCAPMFEVDRNGKPIGKQAAKTQRSATKK